MMAGGRPRLIQSPEEFEQRAIAYFDEKSSEKQPITVTGLALAVGLSSREALDEYGRREEFSDTVKWAKAVVASGYEARLWDSSPTGAIFALKNMGWSDRQELEHTGKNGGPIQQAVTMTPGDAYLRMLGGDAR